MNDQCIPTAVNPHTSEEFFVFSCFNQDQHLDFVDFKNLNERLKAKSIQEKLTNLWLDRAFKSIDNSGDCWIIWVYNVYTWEAL